MAPPKRAVFTLNLDSQTDSAYRRIEDHSKPHDDDKGADVLQSTGPSVSSTHVEFVTEPVATTRCESGHRSVEGGAVVGCDDSGEGTAGKEVNSGKGQGQTKEKATTKGKATYSFTKRTRKVENRSSESKKNRVWEVYDTSDL